MGKLNRALLPVYTFARIDIKRLFRDKVAIFFVFIFPLIFLLVFGGLFGSDNNVSFDVALINQSREATAQDVAKQLRKDKVIKVDKEVADLDTAKERMNRGELDAAIILPKDFGAVQNGRYPSGEAVIVYDQNNSQASAALAAILGAQFQAINDKLVNNETPFTVTTKSTATKGLTQLDYIFSGLLGFTILSLGIFGPTSVFPRLKQRGVLRRYQTTTLKVWQYFLGNVLSNALYGILSVALMFAVALTFFDLNMRGDYLSLIALVALGTATLFGIGLAIGGWAKNENQAAPLANMITFPMMFLSGVFFPRFLMPEWLQSVSGFLPLTPVVDGARFIITEGKTIFDIGAQIGLLAVWLVVIYAIALRVFKWE